MAPINTDKKLLHENPIPHSIFGNLSFSNARLTTGIILLAASIEPTFATTNVLSTQTSEVQAFNLSGPSTSDRAKLQLEVELTSHLVRELKIFPSVKNHAVALSSGKAKLRMTELVCSKDVHAIAAHGGDSVIQISFPMLKELIDCIEPHYEKGSPKVLAEVAFLLIPVVLHEMEHAASEKRLERILGCKFPCLSLEEEYLAYMWEAEFSLNHWLPAFKNRRDPSTYGRSADDLVKTVRQITQAYEQGRLTAIKNLVDRWYVSEISIELIQDPDAYAKLMINRIETYLEAYRIYALGSPEAREEELIASKFRDSLSVLKDQKKMEQVRHYYLKRLEGLRSNSFFSPPRSEKKGYNK